MSGTHCAKLPKVRSRKDSFAGIGLSGRSYNQDRFADESTVGRAAVCGYVSAAVPTPESYFGYTMGADRKLLDWSKVVSYFQLLKDNSDRIRVDELGKSTEGRPFIAATIASPETLVNLDRYREIQAN